MALAKKSSKETPDDEHKTTEQYLAIASCGNEKMRLNSRKSFTV